MCYICGAVSGGSSFVAGIHACAWAAVENGYQRDIAGQGSMRDRGEEKLSNDLRDKVYECSACGAKSNMSCTVNGATVCAGCFLAVCREAEPTKTPSARGCIR